MRALSRAPKHAPRGVVFRGDAATLLSELSATATQMDVELAAIERFMDPAHQRKALATVSTKPNQLVETTNTARHTILSTAAENRARQLDALRDKVAVQATALDNYRRQRRGLSL